MQESPAHSIDLKVVSAARVGKMGQTDVERVSGIVLVFARGGCDLAAVSLPSSL